MQDLIPKYISGDISMEERKKLLKNIKEDKTVHDEFVDALNLHGLIGWLPKEYDSIEKIPQLISLKKECAHKHFELKYLYRYVAVACIAVLSTWLINKALYKSPLPELSKVAYEEVYVPVGQHAQVTLQDGTKVLLNSRTTLRYPNHFINGERKVELDGEGYFEVAKNKKRPFIVCTEKVSVKVLGTKFNVFAYKETNAFAAFLLEGSVKLYKNDDETCNIMMSPHDKVSLTNGLFVKRHFDDADFISWKDGIYTFNDMRLEDIMKKLEIYYDIHIVIENRNLCNFRYSGKFRQIDGLENVLQILQKVHSFTYTEDNANKKIIIR